MNNEIKLKPCPFCGKPGKFRTLHSTRYRESYAAGCSNIQCAMKGYSPFYATPEEAAKVWNTRARQRTKRKKEEREP